ncbi:MAG: ABC transporter permease [Chloroflexota bacterium]
MDLLAATWQYIEANQARFQAAVVAHLQLSLGALLIAVLLFVPLGVLVSRGGPGASGVLALVAGSRVVPSLAVLFLLLPFMGLGNGPALVALVLLAGPPIVLNTDAGLKAVDPAVLEAARGMGLTPWQVFRTVRFPLALPVIVAGVRSASVEVIGSATLAAFIGAGGLGQFITSGLTLLDPRMLLAGAIPVTLMALAAEGLFGLLERRLAPGRAAG